jgi:uncharacterized protein YhhL (DUF1145 family)
MENLGIFYGHLVYFTAIGNILWPFGIFCRHLVYVLFTVLVFCTKENLAILLLNGTKRQQAAQFPYVRVAKMRDEQKFFFVKNVG